jgi:PKD repeat protein
MKKNFWVIAVTFLSITLLVNFKASAQFPNIALTATCNAFGGGTTPWNWQNINNGTWSACGIQDAFVWTTTPPNQSEWMEWAWSTPQSMGKIVIFHAQTTGRFLTGGTVQYWNGSAFVDYYTFTNLNQANCENTITFTNPITTTKMRIAKFQMTGTGQLSNPNFREIEIYNTHVYQVDAGISAVDSPALNVLPGMHQVAIRLMSYGSDTLKTVNINWSVNGAMQTTLPWTGTLTKNQNTSVSLGTFNFPNGVYTLKAWTSNPNNKLDSNRVNDTIKVTIISCNSLSGTLIVDKSGNGQFTDIPTVINALAYCGINGPVTIRIRPGTYTGRVVIPGTIPGVSATNTITLDGGSRDSTKLEVTASTPSQYAVIALNGADYITIKNLTLENLHATYACAVHFGAGADYNTVENCILRVSNTTTSSYAIPVIMSSSEAAPTGYGNSGNYNLIKNNVLIGGYYGFRMYGTSTAVHAMGNQVIGNTIQEFYYYGTYYYYIKNLLFQYNKVHKPRYAYAYGVMAYYTYNSVFDGNTINPGNYGLMLYYHQNTGTDSTVVSNNIITNFMNGTYQVGIYMYQPYRMHVINNSIWVDGTYSFVTSYGCIYNYGSQSSVIKNNIFKSTGNLPCISFNSANHAPGTIDYNNYVVKSTSLVAYDGGTYATLGLWRAGRPDQNMNSITLEPEFVDYKDLHLQLSSPRMLGTYYAFPKDVDGDNRCDISTTMGADEYHYVNLPPTAGFVSNDTACENSPISCWNKASANDVTKNNWYVNGVMKANTINFIYSPVSTGIDTVSLATRNCFGIDTFTKLITVVVPSKSPETEFVASKNRVKIGDYVRLNDLTAECPTSWQWEIVPDTVLDLITGLNKPAFTFLNGTNYNSQNPELVFNYSGLYDVSLKTSNGIGIGTTETKKDYISVVPAFLLCFGSDKTEEPEGFLYDNGGKIGNYLPNKFCTYSIQPCASEVNLNFIKFNLSSGDYVRLYDGVDNKGTPLWDKKQYPYGLGNANQASFPKEEDFFTAKSGSMYIEFETDASLVADGIEAVWNSAPGVFSAPVASFNVTDSNCNGSLVFFQNTSIGDFNKYFWDFDGNGVFESQQANPTWVYETDGFYNVRLIVVNCGGTDTFDKSILVFTSINQPTVDFEASNTRPNMGAEAVTLSGYASSYCVDTFSWIISPSSYIIKKGNLNSYTLDVIFNDSTCYDITLISGYQGMMDTMVKPCYVRPIEYCFPNFSYITTDIGISRVEFGDIDQYSECGKRPYEDFTATGNSTLLEQSVTYHFTISRNTNFNYIQRKIWVDFNIDGDFEDAGEMVASDPMSNSLVWTGSFTIPMTATPGRSRLRVGVAAINQPLGSCSILNNGEYEDYSVVLSKIITPPVIILYGASLMKIQECGSYSEPGATATNVLGQSVTVVISGTVDANVPATYYVKYNATDQFGNKAEEKVRMVIVEPDATIPDFTMIGNAYDTLVVHNTYSDPGYTVTDGCSGFDRVDVNSTLDVNVLGMYKITYTSYDKRGNAAVNNRYVTVIDNIPPVITVFDPDTIFIEVNTALNPRVLQITDNYYQTFSIATSGTFYQNFNTGLATSIGIYTLIYDAIDGSNNTARKTFWIEVGDQTSPLIVLNGSRIINICRYDTFAEEGYVVEDNVDANPKVVRAGTYFSDYMVNYDHGIYEIQYKATDESNNYSYISRLVYVSDTAECAMSIMEAGQKGYKVYPNPSQGLINIEMQAIESGSVEVFSALGQRVYSKEFRNSKLLQLDLRHLESGMYSVRLSGNGESYYTNINIAH